MALQAREALQKIFKDADAEAVDLLLKAAQVNDYPKDTYLCKEGEVEDTFYIILSGRVDIFRTIEGRTFVLDYQDAGTSFGEIALILDTPRTADVVTTEDTRVIEIKREAFAAHIRDDSQTLLRVVQLILNRILTQQERRLTELVKKSDHSDS
jgi:CRP-like cAMP-binding protein